MVCYDQLATAYARHRRLHPGVLRNLLEQGGATKESAVLEVGCGTGQYISGVQALTGCRAFGIDPAEAMLDKAGARSSAADLRIGRAERLDFPDRSFDLLFSVDVIHHVTDRAAFLREAYRVLKPGGRLCTVTDSEWIIRNRRPLSNYFPETVEPELRRYPDLPQLQRWMTEIGFVTVSECMEEMSFSLEDIQPYRDKAYSALHLISDEAHAAGIRRMEADLSQGPIPCVSRYALLWGIRPMEAGPSRPPLWIRRLL